MPPGPRTGGSGGCASTATGAPDAHPADVSAGWDFAGWSDVGSASARAAGPAETRSAETGSEVVGSAESGSDTAAPAESGLETAGPGYGGADGGRADGSDGGTDGSGEEPNEEDVCHACACHGYDRGGSYSAKLIAPLGEASSSTARTSSPVRRPAAFAGSDTVAEARMNTGAEPYRAHTRRSLRRTCATWEPKTPR